MSCNFDSELCFGWHQSQFSDVFDWTRGTGGTLSLNTGPSSDHTTGSGEIPFHLFITVAVGLGWLYCHFTENVELRVYVILEGKEIGYNIYVVIITPASLKPTKKRKNLV